MSQGNHIVKSKIFEVSFNLESEGVQFQKQFSDLVRNELNQITERCLAHFDGQATHYIHRIELNLHDIPYDGFEQVMPQLYEEKLMRVLSEKLSHQNIAKNETGDEPTNENLITMIRYFLIKGYMPWNFNEANWSSFEALFKHALARHQHELLKELDLLLKSEAGRIRLVNHLSDTSIQELIRKVEPSQATLIINYHTDWINIEKEKPNFKSSEHELSKRFWLFIFHYLYEERGSYFNTRSFLLSTLRQMAAHFNVSFEFAVSLLKESYENQDKLASKTAFHQMIGDILKDYNIDSATAKVQRKEVEVPTDYLKLEELIGFVRTGNWSSNIEHPEKKYERSVLFYLEHQPDRMIDLLKQIAGSHAYVYRLIKPLQEKTIHLLVGILAPSEKKTVITYHTKIIETQKTKSFVQTPGHDFPKIIWSLIIAVLADNHGSYFNQKAFLRSLIQGMALRFNMAYKQLIIKLKAALDLLEKTDKGYSKFTKLVKEIYSADFKTAKKSIASALKFADFDIEWIGHTLLTNKLHPEIEKQGFHNLKDFIRLYSVHLPVRFFEVVQHNFDKPKFAKHVLKELDRPALSALVKGAKLTTEQPWLSTFDVVEGMAALEILNPVAHQKAIKEFSIKWVLGLMPKNKHSLEKEIMALADKHGLDFNQLMKSFLWIAEETHNQVLLEPLNWIAGRYKISSRKTIERLVTKRKEGSSGMEASRVDQLVTILLSGVHGIFDRKTALRLGFKSVDDVLTYLKKNKPDRLKRAFSSLLMESHPFVGIGREIPLNSFYALLSTLNGAEGRFLVNLLRQLELNLNPGAQSVNRFLSAARSLALINVSKRQFDLNRFLEEFVTLILSTSPSVYIQVIPMLTKNLSSLSLPSTGNAQSAIHKLEKHLSDIIDLRSPMDKTSLKNIIEQEFFDKTLLKESSVKPYFQESTEAVYDEIFIENSGLVILNAYLPVLFERFGLTKSGSFLSSDHQQKAVLLLQHLLLDQPPVDEHYLPLNKLLCGLPLAQPIQTSLTPTKKEMKMVHGLIEAVIEHWTAIGKSSIEGFRGSWLWRKGKLEHKEEHWELHVESNSYDMLLDRLPFSLSPVKYSWMEKPLIVNWR